jgi:hypothetical protein
MRLGKTAGSGTSESISDRKELFFRIPPHGTSTGTLLHMYSLKFPVSNFLQIRAGSKFPSTIGKERGLARIYIE